MSPKPDADPVPIAIVAVAVADAHQHEVAALDGYYRFQWLNADAPAGREGQGDQTPPIHAYASRNVPSRYFTTAGTAACPMAERNDDACTVPPWSPSGCQ